MIPKSVKRFSEKIMLKQEAASRPRKGHVNIAMTAWICADAAANSPS